MTDLQIEIGLGVLLAIAIVAAVCALVARSSTRKRAEDAIAERDEERQRASGLMAEAARLPEVRERAERAEKQVRDAAQEGQRLNTRIATLDTEARRDREGRDASDSAAESLRGQLAERSTRVETLQTALAAAEAELTVLRQQLDGAHSELAQSRANQSTLQKQLLEQTQLATKAGSERDAVTQLQKETVAFLDRAKTELRSSFTDAASKVFDEKAIALDRKIEVSSEQSRTGLEAKLKPFQETVTQFRERLETITLDNTKGRAELVGKIGELTSLNQNMAAAADSLTKALKGNAKMRGDWGELVLDTVLKSSGLVEGTNYERQTRVHDEELDKQRVPDVVVHLPDGRKVVVDSKVNLIAWAEATNADDQTLIDDALRRHSLALRNHVRDLSDKNYPALIGADALQITIAFVPIEGALSHALAHMPDLQTQAFDKKVVFATPNTLMAMLQVVERLWTRDKLQRQVATIANEAGKLLDALTSFLSEFEAIETQVGKTSATVAAARKRLQTSQQSVIARAQRLVEAGARGKKALAEELIPVEPTEAAIPLEADSDAGDNPDV